MKPGTRSIVGLFRAAHDALRAAIINGTGVMAFNGHAWVGGNPSDTGEHPIVFLQTTHLEKVDGERTRCQIDLQMDFVLQPAEQREILTQICIHARDNNIDVRTSCATRPDEFTGL